LNIHHHPSVESAVGMTHGRRTAPRIMRLNHSCSLSRSARTMPIQILKKTATLVKTKEFWKVWRKASLCHRLMKIASTTQRIRRPMKAFDIEKYSAITNG